MSITFHPKVNELARSRQVAEQVGNAFMTNWIISGLELSVPGSGRNVPVSSGKAFINGYIVDLVAMTLQVPNNATSTVYLGADLDGQNNVNHFELSHDVPSSGYYVVLGQVVVSGGNITSVNEIGRSVEDRMIKTANIENNAVTTDKIPNSAITTDKIANDAVTFAKVENVANNTILGRISSGAGDIEELTKAQVLDVLDLTEAPVIKYKLFDQVVNNSNTLVNDDDFQFTLSADTVYEVNAQIYINDGSGDYKYQFFLPSDALCNLIVYDANVNAGNTSSGLIETPFRLDTTNQVRTKTTSGYIRVVGLIKTVSAGNLVYKFAQNTASATTPARTMMGSNIEIRGTDADFESQTYVEYVIVAGGGGGAYFDQGGGGGAGGYRSSVVGENSGGGASAESLIIPTYGLSYNVVVGSGGAGGVNYSDGSSGSSSSFAGISSTGGGGGGTSNGVNGGSGGGASGASTPRVGGTGTSGQGRNGGSTPNNTWVIRGACGGGGASLAGDSGADGKGGNGGNGVSSLITGSSVTRAGGGGGGVAPGGIVGFGGSGGGGNGGVNSSGVNASPANSGGGGGGGGDRSGGSGASGVVILRTKDTDSVATTTGSPSITVSGGYRIYEFTATGTIIFNRS